MQSTSLFNYCTGQSTSKSSIYSRPSQSSSSSLSSSSSSESELKIKCRCLSFLPRHRHQNPILPPRALIQKLQLHFLLHFHPPPPTPPRSRHPSCTWLSCTSCQREVEYGAWWNIIVRTFNVCPICNDKLVVSSLVRREGLSSC